MTHRQRSFGQHWATQTLGTTIFPGTSSFHQLSFALGLLLTCCVVRAQCASGCQFRYESALGLPQAQSWTVTGTGAASMNAGVLRLDASTPLQAMDVTSTPTAPSFWTDGHVMEARLRVIAGSTRSINGAYRASVVFGGLDSRRQSCFVLIGSSEVALSANFNNNTSVGFAATPFDTTDSMHTYRISSV
jgi:hypothetical protein